MVETAPIVVVKVGGSLFGWPSLAPRLETFLDVGLGGPARVVLIAGGGPLADSLRALDAVHGLGDEAAHRLALGAMDLTAELLARLVARSRYVRGLDDLADAWGGRLRPVLAVRRHLEEVDERGGDPLPLSWDVTSDAIAARVADRLGADRLVLLKSRAAHEATRAEAAANGLVDPAFPAASARLACVEVVALRDVDARPRRLAP